jgi:hypothetical protein
MAYTGIVAGPFWESKEHEVSTIRKDPRFGITRSSIHKAGAAQFFALKEQSGPEVFRLGPKLASTEEQNPTSDQKPVRYGAPGIRCKEIPKVRLAASVMRIFP